MVVVNFITRHGETLSCRSMRNVDRHFKPTTITEKLVKSVMNTTMSR